MNRGRAGSFSRRRKQRILAVILISAFYFAGRPAHAWDARTHMLIARLAVGALPRSPLARIMSANEPLLEQDAVAPDFELKRLYGHAEEIRHYIDLEYFGPNPLAALDPDLATMRRRYGVRTLDRSGTLPWTITETASAVAAAWRLDDCAQVIRRSGYLAHYVGDASQPLHSTRYYDGYAGDAGVHRRFEAAVDHEVGEIERAARPQVRAAKIDSVWAVEIAEIGQANALVQEVITSDRTARAEAAGDSRTYDRALMRSERAMIAGQIAAASSALASIWLYEWTQAGNPAACLGGSSRLPFGSHPAAS